MSETVSTPDAAADGPRVLLVEDNEAALKGLSRLLQAQGYRVTTAFTGAEAMEALDGGPAFQFVLTDLQLPDLDGREIARKAREGVPPPRTIVITGWDLDLDADGQGRWGIDDLLSKPIDVRDLLKVLRRHSPIAPPDGTADGV